MSSGALVRQVTEPGLKASGEGDGAAMQRGAAEEV